MKYRYFISYCWVSDDEKTSGNGNSEFQRSARIRRIEDLSSIARQIEEESDTIENCVITNYKRFW